MKTINSKDGTPIAFDIMGNGESLILVDGALCGRTFGPMPGLAALLSKDFKVITYDRRGRGDSGDSGNYSAEREIEDIEALIHAAGENVNLFGISSGAGLAVLAASRGLKIKKLAIYEPPYIAGKDKDDHLNHEANLKKILETGKRGAAVRYFLSDMVKVPSFFVIMTQLMPVWKKLKALAHTLPYDAAVMGDFTIPEKIMTGISLPVLIMGGGKSDARLQNIVTEVAGIFPNGKLNILEGQTHNVKAEVIAPFLVNFFKDP